MRVLALMPHPDDIEILCAGTLLRLQRFGWEIHTATMTPGDKGSAELTPEEIAQIRREEARLAALAIGAASYACLEFSDLEIVFDNASRARVAAALRSVRPQIVITTPPVDYMFDHEITAWLVRDACFNAAVPNYRTPGGDRPIDAIPYLYYADPIGGHDLFGTPTPVDLVVDISTVIEEKCAALACHVSQREWLRKQHGLDDYVDSMRRWSAARGALIGAAYAEGFRRHVGHPHPTDDPIGALLSGQRLPAEEMRS